MSSSVRSIPSFVCDRWEVECGIGRTAHRDDEGYGVLEGFACEDVARVDAFAQEVHHCGASFAG